MSTRKIKVKGEVEPCPDCGNTNEFVIHSKFMGTDYCEVWAACKCGYSVSDGDRIEDVWGGTDNDMCLYAMQVTWNDPLYEKRIEQ